jgi:carboxyl-terminal processing protease
MAGALQDHDRALIVGETTFGKALVQSIIPLEYGTGLTITTSRYYTPSGRTIQRDYSQVGYYDYIYGGGIGSERIIPTEKGAASRTASGRPVFGGAITPDQVGVVKPRVLTPLHNRLFDPIFGFARELINGRIAAQDFDTRQFQIDGPPNLKHDLQPGELNVDDRLFKAFKEYVANKRDLYKLTDAQLDREREFIKRQLRYDLVTAAYGVVNASRVLIVDDPQILKALQVLPEARDLAATTTKSATP